MTTYLLANIGTRDVTTEEVPFPPECYAPNKTLLARPAGEYLRQPEVYRQHMGQIALPMIEKALRYLGARPKREIWKAGISPAEFQVVLFATDQPETVDARYRNGDTANFAALIRDVIVDRYGVMKKHVFIRTTDHNPSDYDQMHQFYGQELPKLATHVKADDHIYLLIVGGTQQMNTMLLFLGSEHFGAQAFPLYVSPDRERPMRLDIARQITRQAVQRNLHVLLQAYAYPTARQLIEREKSVVDEQTMLVDVLRYAEQRRNLALEEAAATLDRPIQRARVLREALKRMQEAIEPPSEVVKLKETIYLAQVAADTGSWADFLARLHRFSEGTMQLMAESLGVKWSDSRKRSSFAAGWWADNRTMLTNIGLVTLEQVAADDREVDRSTLRKIIEHLAQVTENTAYRQALDQLAVIDKPVPLRNNIVHRFTPISEADICEKAGVTVAELLQAMRAAYNLVFGVVVPVASPYADINHVCLQLFEGAV